MGFPATPKGSQRQCNILYGCFRPEIHAYVAWAFVVIFPLVALAIYRISVKRSRYRGICDLEKGVLVHCESEAQQPPLSALNAKAQTVPDVYSAVAHHARNVKAVLQMIIGVLAVCVVGWHFLEMPAQTSHQATSLLIDGIGVGLAAAAALELAYTLFTSGPDEALDPLMLAVAAALLVQVARIEKTPSIGQVTALLLQGLLLTVLFATRLMLVERNEDESYGPNIWWIQRVPRRKHENR